MTMLPFRVVSTILHVMALEINYTSIRPTKLITFIQIKAVIKKLITQKWRRYIWLSLLLKTEWLVYLPIIRYFDYKRMRVDCVFMIMTLQTVLNIILKYLTLLTPKTTVQEDNHIQYTVSYVFIFFQTL